jgi:hypothetical protein
MSNQIVSNPRNLQLLKEEDSSLRQFVEAMRSLFGERAPRLSEEYEKHYAYILAGKPLARLFSDPFPGLSMRERRAPFFREMARLQLIHDQLQVEATRGLLAKAAAAKGAPTLAHLLSPPTSSIPPAPAGASAFCTQCGKPVAATSKFCGSCGRPAPA